MIKYFSTGYFDRYISVLLIAMALWMPVLFFADYEPVSYKSSLFDLSQIMLLNPLVTKISFFLLVLITAFIINLTVINFGFVGKLSTLVMLFYVLSMSLFIEQMAFNPIIICNFLVVLAFIYLMGIPEKSNSLATIFNASFIIGLASLIYLPAVFMIILIWNAVFIHRVAYWRTIIIPIIGILLPFIFAGTCFFYSGILDKQIDLVISAFTPDLAFIFPDRILEIVIVGIVTLLLMISFIGIFGSLNEKNINQRRNLRIFLDYFVILLIIQVLYTESIIGLTYLGLPGSVIIGSWLNDIKKQKWYNIVIISLLILILINAYIPVYNIVITNL